MPTRKQPKKRASKFSIWLNRQLESAGRAQLEIAKEAGFRAEDLTKWKKGQAIPEMDNLLRLAHYFKEDPEKLFQMAGKPDLVGAYRLFLPEYEEKELSEKDLYRNKRHAELHQRIQILLAEGLEKEVDEQIRRLESFDFNYLRLREAIELSRASAGFVSAEVFGKRSCLYWHGLAFQQVDLRIPDKGKSGWVVFEGVADPDGEKVHLCLKGPKAEIKGSVEEMIGTCIVSWLRVVSRVLVLAQIRQSHPKSRELFTHAPLLDKEKGG